VRRNIWHHEGGDHQDVNVGHEVRWVAKIEAQWEAIKEEYKGHGVRANRSNAVLGDLAIARGKKCSKGAD